MYFNLEWIGTIGTYDAQSHTNTQLWSNGKKIERIFGPIHNWLINYRITTVLLFEILHFSLLFDRLLRSDYWKICQTLSPLNLFQMNCILCISYWSKSIIRISIHWPSDNGPNQWDQHMDQEKEKLANKFRLIITCEQEKEKQKYWNNKCFGHPMNMNVQYFTNGEMVRCHILNRYLR